jgi:hypothetical protein
MSTQDMTRLSADTGFSLPTIRKWASDPSSVHHSTSVALERAAKRLRIEVERGDA